LGGGIRSGNDLKAFIPGGASSFWFGPDRLDFPLDESKVKGEGGSMMGSGSVIAMDETTCMVRASWRLVRFFSRESCGQCTPCREGSSWLDKIMYRIETGSGRPEDLDLLLDVCDNISPGVQWPSKWPPNMTTICPLGPSIPPPIVSAIGLFRDEFLVHIKDGGCPYD
jgi:NADH-quinone oxidoreductase subunit F